MAQATFVTPQTLDPRKATNVKLKELHAYDDGSADVLIVWRDAANNVVRSVGKHLTGAQVAAWFANQETTMLTKYLAAEGYDPADYTIG